MFHSGTSQNAPGALNQPLSAFERGAAPEAITQFDRALVASPQDYNATYLLVTYFANSGYEVDSVITGQSTGNEINFLSSTVGGTLRIKVVAHLTDDRRADVFGYNTQTGDWFQALNVADGTFTTHAGAWTPGWQTALGDLDGDGRDGLFVYDPETGAWSRYLTGDSKPHDTVDLVEESGTWAPWLSIVGRP